MKRQRPRLLYLLEREDGAVKVGSSTHPARRMLELERFQEKLFVLLGEWPNAEAFKIEMAVHRKMRARDFDLVEHGGDETYWASAAETLSIIRAVLREWKPRRRAQTEKDQAHGET
jgi:hypothetical protein